MADDVLINKAASIERCVARAREEYAADPDGFAHNFSRQDAAILNIQRACEAALDMGLHISDANDWASHKAPGTPSLCWRKPTG
jgi:hypothetical protein